MAFCKKNTIGSLKSKISPGLSLGSGRFRGCVTLVPVMGGDPWTMMVAMETWNMGLVRGGLHTCSALRADQQWGTFWEALGGAPTDSDQSELQWCFVIGPLYWSHSATISLVDSK